jgi:hypothetical protein
MGIRDSMFVYHTFLMWSCIVPTFSLLYDNSNVLQSSVYPVKIVQMDFLL